MEDEEDLFFNSYEQDMTDSIFDYYFKCKIDDVNGMSNDIEIIIENYCEENDIHIVSVDTLVAEIIEILMRDKNDYIEFFVQEYYKDVFHGQINTINDKLCGSIVFDRLDKNISYHNKFDFENNEITELEYSSISRSENVIYIETHNALDYCENYINRFNRRTSLISTPTRELLNYIRSNKKLSFVENRELELTKQIVADIIEEITHGNIACSKNGKIHFIEQETENVIEISNMSSGLKIFTIIQTLLENYSLKKSDILIVDEPEVNLHPKWQVALAEIMVRIYHELGIYVLINSHSPYFIRAIEVKMAQYGCGKNTNFYYMQNNGAGYEAVNVNDNLEIIYDALYQPLETL